MPSEISSIQVAACWTINKETSGQQRDDSSSSKLYGVLFLCVVPAINWSGRLENNCPKIERGAP
jgi:hypothetical protein